MDIATRRIARGVADMNLVMELREKFLGIDGETDRAYQTGQACRLGYCARSSAELASSVALGGLTFTKSASRQSATLAAPAMRTAFFSFLTALPHG
jgi:hypothetical protein